MRTASVIRKARVAPGGPVLHPSQKMKLAAVRASPGNSCYQSDSNASSNSDSQIVMTVVVVVVVKVVVSSSSSNRTGDSVPAYAMALRPLAQRQVARRPSSIAQPVPMCAVPMCEPSDAAEAAARAPPEWRAARAARLAEQKRERER